jgi:hypothetical protein
MKSLEGPESDPWLCMFLQRLPIPMALLGFWGDFLKACGHCKVPL